MATSYIVDPIRLPMDVRRARSSDFPNDKNRKSKDK